MSDDAYLVCPPCQVLLPLGKPLVGDDGSVVRFHRGAEDAPPNSGQPDLTRALWKFLAEHAGHPMRVKFSYEPDFDVIAGFRRVGGDTVDDVPFDEYLRDWPG
ncbi:hypothetical protein [Actinocrispum wychmicini]|uniref:Uncharacterized protein n=1 Tax=Actinocrispum wychmicini TaxID=1213861 RepID=A0A4R2J7B2_9PSEU|nr:hypothetical protein [Actinocrispum wychmicini]TCO52476.1 hypothetical protein EV192_112208 [Actinocrispum wychmicini]